MEALDTPFAPAPRVARPSQEWLRLAQLAKVLAWASLGWLTIEGTVGVVAGLVAGSIALVGFGLDSAIEGLASVIIVWRFTGARTLSAHSERRAQKLVAVSFCLLAPYVAVESLRTLIVEHHAETSIVGIALTAGTLAICPGWESRSRGSVTGLDRSRPRARASRTCSAPGLQQEYSSDCLPIQRWASGGLIRWSGRGSRWPVRSPDARPGAERAAHARSARSQTSGWRPDLSVGDKPCQPWA
jgi:hypothetical protein